MPAESKTAVVAALSANFLIAAAKFFAAGISGSSAMLSEGVHSLVDTANEILLLVGLHRSKMPADEQHPFGHGRELYFWSMIVAVLFFGLGGGLTIYEGIARVRAPRPLEDPTWSYVVLAIAAVAEGVSLRIGYRNFRKMMPRDPLLQAIHRSKDPSIFTVLLEDSAALAGLAAAFLGVLLSHLFDLPVLDGAASIVIGVILACAALFLGNEIRGLLVGEGADPKTVQIIREIAGGDPAVEAVNPPLTAYLGPENLVIALELQFRDTIGAEELTGAVDRIERQIRERLPVSAQIFIEAESIARKPARKTI